MDKSSPEKSNPSQHHDAWSGWGAIIGGASGIVIGLFFHKVVILGLALGFVGWIIGAVVDRAHQ